MSGCSPLCVWYTGKGGLFISQQTFGKHTGGGLLISLQIVGVSLYTPEVVLCSFLRRPDAGGNEAVDWCCCLASLRSCWSFKNVLTSYYPLRWLTRCGNEAVDWCRCLTFLRNCWSLQKCPHLLTPREGRLTRLDALWKRGCGLKLLSHLAAELLTPSTISHLLTPRERCCFVCPLSLRWCLSGYDLLYTPFVEAGPGI